MTFTKILCPIDFSPGSQQAMRVASRLANETNAELVLFHAWYLPEISYMGGFTVSPEVIQQMTDNAERGVDDAAREATTLGVKRVTRKLVVGVPWQMIVETLEQDTAFDLAVIGTRGRTGLSRILLGSVAQDVVRHAPCSVLAVHPGKESTSFSHVLCPVDFSASSQHAVDLAAQLARPGGAGITLAHVLEIPVAYAGEPFVPDFTRDLDKASVKRLDEWASQLRSKIDAPVVVRTRIGSPGAQALAILEDDPTFDLVVMGSHGRTGIRRILLGSVAEKVVRHAQCPVLVARKRG